LELAEFRVVILVMVFEGLHAGQQDLNGVLVVGEESRGVFPGGASEGSAFRFRGGLTHGWQANGISE